MALAPAGEAWKERGLGSEGGEAVSYLFGPWSFLSQLYYQSAKNLSVKVLNPSAWSS